MQAQIALLGDVGERDVARADDRIPGIPTHACFLKHAFDAFGGHGSIGDEHDRAALAAEARQGIAGLGIGRAPVVHDTPDVAEHRLVACEQRTGVENNRRRHGAGNLPGFGLRATG